MNQNGDTGENWSWKIQQKSKARNLERNENLLKTFLSLQNHTFMHFRLQHPLASLHSFNLLNLVAQTLGGFILDRQWKILPKNGIQHPETNRQFCSVGSIFFSVNLT